jgi:hypothetical protein
LAIDQKQPCEQNPGTRVIRCCNTIGRSRGIGLHPGAGGNWRTRLFVGEFLYAIGLASLAPLKGSLILIAGESLRIGRLARGGGVPPTAGGGTFEPPGAAKPSWGRSFRNEAFKWGVCLAIGAFTITLRDRLAEVLLAAAILVGLVFMAPDFRVDARKR